MIGRFGNSRSSVTGTTGMAGSSPASISIPSTCRATSCRSCRRSSRSAIARSACIRARSRSASSWWAVRRAAEARLGRRRTLWLGVGGLARRHAAVPRAGAVGQHLGLLPDGRARRAAARRSCRRVLADLHGERRAEAYAGQAIVAYAFGLAAPLLAGARDLGGARLARGGAVRRRGRDRDRARVPAHAVAEAAPPPRDGAAATARNCRRPTGPIGRC